MDEGQSSTIARLATIDRHYSLFPNQQHIEEQPYLCLPISGSCTAVRKGAWFCAAPPHLAAILRTPYTPADRRSRLSETSDTSNGRTITIQHVVTHTITLKRAPSLDPPPKGKRRRTSESRDQ
ncbi:hypothetical protein AnigIFM56816_008687 [Aspergillus niger]|nr:hypothetical protein AnigIFM56816_008687 [Aspergillus niger]